MFISCVPNSHPFYLHTILLKVCFRCHSFDNVLTTEEFYLKVSVQNTVLTELFSTFSDNIGFDVDIFSTHRVLHYLE